MSKRPVIESEKPVWHDEDDDDLIVTVPKKVKKTMKVELKRTTDNDEGELDSKVNSVLFQGFPVKFCRNTCKDFKKRSRSVTETLQNGRKLRKVGNYRFKKKSL